MVDIKIRDTLVDGIGPWGWPAKDTGAWDGPVDDWLVSHSNVITNISRKRTAIQAGGNCGLYPRLLTQHFQHIHTFEPEETNLFFLMMNNVEQVENGIVTVHPKALGRSSRRCGMNKAPAENVGMFTINEAGNSVDMTSIDETFPDVDTVDLIWLDIEGYEYEALEGGAKLIERNLPVIGVERASERVKLRLNALGYYAKLISKMDTFFVHPNGNQIEAKSS